MISLTSIVMEPRKVVAAPKARQISWTFQLFLLRSLLLAGDFLRLRVIMSLSPSVGSASGTLGFRGLGVPLNYFSLRADVLTFCPFSQI